MKSLHPAPRWSFMLLVVFGVGAAAACLRTHHEVETYHKIDAHIVVDIRQIQEEAAQTENYVRGTDAAGSPNTGETDTNPPTSRAVPTPQTRRTWLSWLDPAATACAQESAVRDEEASENTRTKIEKDAIERRRQRAETVENALKRGWVGETHHGYLELLLETTEDNRQRREKLQALVKAENHDRRIIYQEIARRKDWDQSRVPLIEVIFAHQIRQKLQEGMWFQVPKDEKRFQDFRRTKLGRKYPDAAPGQWLRAK